MAMVDPRKAIYPKKYIKRIVRIIHDGRTNTQFSIAELELYGGAIVLGIRHDLSDWSPDPDKGYPVIRGQFPGWFLLPSSHPTLGKLITILNKYNKIKNQKNVKKPKQSRKKKIYKSGRNRDKITVNKIANGIPR